MLFPLYNASRKTDERFSVLGGTPACVTVTTMGVNPVAVTVIFATRDVVSGFAR